MDALGEEAVLQFMNMTRYRIGRTYSTERNLRSNPQFTTRYRQQLEDYLVRYATGETAEPKKSPEFGAVAQ